MSDFGGLTDAEVIVKVADSLSISEFKLFQVAYEDWYQHAVSEREIERHFVRYLFKQEAPSWVRHYARNKEREIESNARACPSVCDVCVVGLFLLWASLIRYVPAITRKDAEIVA